MNENTTKVDGVVVIEISNDKLLEIVKTSYDSGYKDAIELSCNWWKRWIASSLNSSERELITNQILEKFQKELLC